MWSMSDANDTLIMAGDNIVKARVINPLHGGNLQRGSGVDTAWKRGRMAFKTSDYLYTRVLFLMAARFVQFINHPRMIYRLIGAGWGR